MCVCAFVSEFAFAKPLPPLQSKQLPICKPLSRQSDLFHRLKHCHASFSHNTWVVQEDYTEWCVSRVWGIHTDYLQSLSLDKLCDPTLSSAAGRKIYSWHICLSKHLSLTSITVNSRVWTFPRIRSNQQKETPLSRSQIIQNIPLPRHATKKNTTTTTKTDVLCTSSFSFFFQHTCKHEHSCMQTHICTHAYTHSRFCELDISLTQLYRIKTNCNITK